MREGRCRTFEGSAAGMQGGFDVVKIEYRSLTSGRNLLPVGRTLGMLDETDFVTGISDGLPYLALETREAID